MLKQICLFVVSCALVALGGAEQKIGEQNIGEWAQAAQGIAASGDQNI